MSESIEISKIFPVSQTRLYQAWLDGAEHGAFTGGEAVIDARVGGRFTAWDGYIEGQNLELTPHTRILQSWRTSEFPEDAEDSLLEVLFNEEEGKTRLILKHTNLPAGTGDEYRQGWVDYYLGPMEQYFAGME